MSFILGLTGPTGAGKSILSAKAEELGFFVIDCDKTARKATENKECLAALASAFGKDILDENGALIRSLLAKKAFSDKARTELLNATVFPFIKELLLLEIKSAKSDKILLDAPTLYESGTDSLCDAVCVVLAEKATRLERIMVRDGLEKQAALLRMNAGKPDEYYKEKTPHILYNNGDKQELEKSFARLVNTIFGG